MLLLQLMVQRMKYDNLLANIALKCFKTPEIKGRGGGGTGLYMVNNAFYEQTEL